MNTFTSALRGKIIFGVFVSLILSFLFIPFIHAEEGVKEGVIEGKILNRTEGKPVPGHAVFLHFLDDKGEKKTVTKKSDREGRFVFRGLSAKPSSHYFISSQYKGVEYSSRMILFDKGEMTQNIEMNLYETTTDDKPIKIEREHLIIDVKDNRYILTNVFVIKNSGDKTLVSSKNDKEGSLVFSLPPGVQKFNSPLFARAGDRLIYSGPIRPGTEQVSFTYELDFAADYLFKKAALYDTDGVDILLSNEGLSLEGSNLYQEEKKSIMGKEFAHFVLKEPLKKGETLSFHIISGKREAHPSPWIISSLVGAIILLGFSYPLLKKRKEARISPPIDKGYVEKESLIKERMALLLVLAKLDDEFEKGILSEGEYKRVRQEKKNRLLEITLNLRRKD